MRERQIMLYDIKDTDKALKTVTLDTSSGLLIPMHDEDTDLLFLGGRVRHRHDHR